MSGDAFSSADDVVNIDDIGESAVPALLANDVDVTVCDVTVVEVVANGKDVEVVKIDVD